MTTKAASKRALFSTLAALALSASAWAGDVYIVRLAEDPAAVYDGGVAGLAPTRAPRGAKLDATAPHVQRYTAFLEARQDSALSRAGGGRVIHRFEFAFNGFAAELSDAAAAKLRAQPGVLAVTKDVKRKLDTFSTPQFLGLPDGLWRDAGGVGRAGENVIVGILDSGVWPENPSFDDRDRQGRRTYKPLRREDWAGGCDVGEQFPLARCNRKLVGARWYGAGWGGEVKIKQAFPYEYWSARDADGHGSHTASTAAGNNGVRAVVDGATLGFISGMAPRARLAIYKVCWGRDADGGGCFNSDSVAAIDQAVADGVDVLNFSISGTSTNFLDPVEVAFLFAADAGVFVAASAGNDGPGASTVAHPSPWLATVAAGSHDRGYQASVLRGSGGSHPGSSLGKGAGPASFVFARDVALASADPNEARLCYPGTLDPARVTGKIVLCDRGVIARTDKSLAVRDAGGIGSVLANTSPNSVNADLHWVPTVHVDHVDGAALRAYAQTSGATVQLTAGVRITVEAPSVASFSSRGPLLASEDLLKPDLMAPGVDVLAAYSPAVAGRDFDMLSGTSMSSPHVAGLAAVLMGIHEDWSPAAVKSALMTTASRETNRGTLFSGGPFDYGAGHVVPTAASDPGLVYDAGFGDWLGFLCGTGQLQASVCASVQIDPSDLNYPSITVGSLAGTQSVERTVTNVGKRSEYFAQVEAPPGIAVTVTPSMLVLDRGESASFSVRLDSTSAAALGQFAFGAITWSDGDRYVRSPLTVRPVALAAPPTVSSSGGPLSIPVSFGYSGGFGATARGLVQAAEIADNVLDDPANDINTALTTGVGITVHVVTVPTGTTYARFSLFNAFTDGNDDLDLYVFDSGGNQVGGSGSGGSDEEVNLPNPAADDYFVVVHGWQTEGPDSNYTLFSYLVDTADAGNMTITAPSTASVGGSGTVGVTFSGLTPGKKYLGAVDYDDGSNAIGETIVRVDP